MVGIDVSIFNFNELDDHVGGGCQALVQNLFHHIGDFILQPLKSIDIVEIDSSNDISQLFVDLMGAFKGWFKQPSNLLSNKHFKGYFWNEKTWRESLSILDCRLNVLF